MRKLSRLWRGLECIPGLVAIPAFWAHHCGDDVSLIRPHLRPTADLGSTFPCPHLSNGDCPRRIVDYEDESLAAICSHPHKLCADLPLARREALVYRLDLDELLRKLSDALCVRITQLAVKTSGVWDLGLSQSRSTRDHPAYLLVCHGSAGFRSALRDLALSCPTPFIVVAPTATHLTVELREELGRRNSSFVSIDDRVGLSDDGRFVALERTEVNQTGTIPVEQRRAAVQHYKQLFDCTDQAIYGPAGVDKSEFYKWIKGTLADRSSKSKRIEELLRKDPTLSARV